MGMAVALFVFICVLAHAQAATIYVQPTGSAGDCGNSSAPCSLLYALSIASSADVLDLSGDFTPDTYGNGFGANVTASIVITSSSSDARLLFATTSDFSANVFVIFSVVSGDVSFSNLIFTSSSSPLSTPSQNVAISIATTGSVTVDSTSFRDISIDTNGDARLVSFSPNSSSSVMLTLNNVVFTNLAGATALYLPNLQDVAALASYVSVNNSQFVGNTHSGSKPLIWFDAASTNLSSFSLVIANTQFSFNQMGFLDGSIPSANRTSNCTLTGITANNNFFNVSYETPFSFFHIYGVQKVMASKLSFSNNALNGTDLSYADPTLFGLVLADFSEVSPVRFEGEVHSSSFVNNSQVSPIVFSCSRKSVCDIVVEGSDFLNNNAEVSAGFSILTSSPESNVQVYNCEFRNNTVFSADYLFQWATQSAIILCNGRATINISGNDTDFSDNGKLRLLGGSCHKNCSTLSPSLGLEVCGKQGTTDATYVMSGIVGVSVLMLAVYHTVYVFLILPKKKVEQEAYFALNQHGS